MILTALKPGRHLNAYIGTLAKLSDASKTELVNSSLEFIQRHLLSFTFMERTNGLLFGEVQSGKTSRIFGIIAACADYDSSFTTFVLLTSNNRNLQRQTIQRAASQLATFNVCDEYEDHKFIHADQSCVSLVVLKKDPNVLKSWVNHLTSADRIRYGPIFVIDDEADNASPNNKVNRKLASVTFDLIEKIRSLGTSSIYLQVTATPQALFLQKLSSTIRPRFTQYFEPGSDYLGGNFYFATPAPFVQKFIAEDERSLLVSSSSIDVEGMWISLATFLVTCAVFHQSQQSCCNALIHPSVSKRDHFVVGEKVQEIMGRLKTHKVQEQSLRYLFAAYQDLKSSKVDIISFEETLHIIQNEIQVNVYLLNSSENAERNNSFEDGYNLIIGGNTLGRGVTFPKLQMFYYVRQSKSPQADTYWQHSRLFGYDRQPALQRVFMPATVYRIFTVFNDSNNNLVRMITTDGDHSIQVLLPKGFNPTRKSVIDLSVYESVVGGTNYFPSDPNVENVVLVDKLIPQENIDKLSEVSVELALQILEATVTGDNVGWPVVRFKSALLTIAECNPSVKIKMITRVNRNISRDTGTLLSPDDRQLGSSITNHIVFTAYRLNGLRSQGWNDKPFWILNVKFPSDLVFHSGQSDNNLDSELV